MIRKKKGAPPKNGSGTGVDKRGSTIAACTSNVWHGRDGERQPPHVCVGRGEDDHCGVYRDDGAERGAGLYKSRPVLESGVRHVCGKHK